MKKNGITWTILRGIFLITALTMLSAGATSPLDRFSPEQQKILQTGEVVYEYISNYESDKKGRGHGEAYAIVNQPIETCYRILTDIENKYQYFPLMKESKIIKSEEQDHQVRRQQDMGARCT